MRWRLELPPRNSVPSFFKTLSVCLCLDVPWIWRLNMADTKQAGLSHWGGVPSSLLVLVPTKLLCQDPRVLFPSYFQYFVNLGGLFTSSLNTTVISIKDILRSVFSVFFLPAFSPFQPADIPLASTTQGCSFHTLFCPFWVTVRQTSLLILLGCFQNHIFSFPLLCFSNPLHKIILLSINYLFVPTNCQDGNSWALGTS